MRPSKLLAYLLACFVLAVAPGPDNCFVLAQSAGAGAMAGIWVTLGLISGLSVHITLAVLGMAAILHRYPRATRTISILGAFYLLTIATSMALNTSTPLATYEALDYMMYYRRGIILNLSNPKVILFFLAFIPQFVPPQSKRPSLWLFLLGLLFALVAFFVMCLYACLGGTLATLLQNSPTLSRLLNLSAAVAIFALALWMLIPRKKQDETPQQ